MKIAVPTKEGNLIDNHFGHCQYYTIFTITENKQIGKETYPSPQGCGCKSNVAMDLAHKGVNVMLAGGIGDGAVNKLATAHIKVVRNCQGDIDTLIDEYLKGDLKDSGTNCSHEGHSHQGEHQCHRHE